MKNWFSIRTLALAALFFLTSAQGADADFFEKKIRPVLVENCYECHSASSKKLKGGLRLDGRAEVLRGGGCWPAICPRKPSESPLINAIGQRDEEKAMPPKKPKLADSIIADFETWVKAGAVWGG